MKQHLHTRNAIKILTIAVFSFISLFIIPLSYGQTVTGNTQSTNNGFFYSFWNDNSQGSASMTLGAAGNYSTTWSNVGNFTAGKGWAVGKADRVVCFSGSFNGGSNGFLALYGWTKNNLIEYYVCENHGSWTPPGNTSDIQQKGTYTSDGGTYTIYTATRTNQPSIIGNATFKQYWSVRTQTRSTGTITFANHVAAWQAAGMPMGTTWDYQIMESEGYHSSGSSNITVSECPTNGCTTPAPTTTASINYDLGATATQLTATGTALKWYTVATSGTALPSAPTPNTTAVGTTKYYVGQTLNNCEGPRVEVTVTVSQKYKIFKVPAPITIDGTIEASWTNASVLPAAATKLLSGTVTNSADLSGNFKAVWDDTYLYILADITDDTKTNESANVYDDDAVEVYVDINNNKATTYGANDVQYSFGWNDGTTVGVLPSGRSSTGITYVAVARTGGYIVEARIPWSTLQGSPVIGQLVGMDFMINDDDNGGTRDGKLSWNAGEDDAWENPSLFGTAILQGFLPCTTPAAPAVTSPLTYCQNATASALTATGTSLLWYASATGGVGSSTATIPSTTATGNINYYVTQNVGGCESARALIAVTVNAAPNAPTVTSPVTYCQNATASALTANGTSLKWYMVATGGTALANTPTPSTSATGTTNYYVSQTSSCESVRSLIAVTVNAAPAVPTALATVSYCQNATTTALTATGTALKWYSVATGGTVLANTPTPSTSAIGTTNYYVSQTTAGCESARTLIAVTVTAAPTATISASSATTFCAGGSVTLTPSAGSSYVWKNGTTQIGSSTSYTANTGGSYTVEVTNANNCTATSTAMVVTVTAAPNAPTATTTLSYCQNETASALTANGTALKWYMFATGGTVLANTPTPSTSATGTTNYYVSQTTTGCESARTLIAVIVNALPTATITASSATTFCAGGSVTLTSSAGNSYVWKNGSSQVGTAASYTAATPGSYTVEVTNANNCTATSTATVVTISTTTNAPTVTPTVSYCKNETATVLTANGTALKWYMVATGGTALANTPTPSTSATGTTNYYVSQMSGCESARALIAVTVNALPTATITASSATTFCSGGSVTLTSSAGNSYVWKNGTSQVGTSATYAAINSGSYTVDVTNTNNCTATSSATVVTVNPAPNAPTVTPTVSYCKNETATALTANGSSLKWYTVTSGGTALANTPTPSTSSSGTTNYYVSQTTTGCESARALIAVTVNDLPNTPTVTAAATYCLNASAAILTATGNGLTWYSVATGGTALANTPTPSTSSTGTTNYYVSQRTTAGCESGRALIAVTVNALPTPPTVTSVVKYCQNEIATTLTAIGTNLTWYTVATGGTALANAPTPSTVSSGTTNYYVSQTNNGCESSRGLITVLINALPTATITVVGNTTILSGETVVLNANTGTDLTYNWYNGNAQIGTGASYTSTTPGNFTVEVTNGLGCKAKSTITSISTAQNQPSVITITSITDNASVQAPVMISATVTDADGAITLVEFLDGDFVIGSSETAPYTMNWTDPSNGSHTITVRATDALGGVTTSDPITITTSLTTGIQSSHNNIYGKVYPIPAKDQVTVETSIDLTDATFRITNTLGEEVFLPISINGYNATLNVNGLAEGVYLMVITENANILTKKIILSH